MGSYCHICDEFVENLDHCELPYGGAPAPPNNDDDKNYYFVNGIKTEFDAELVKEDASIVVDDSEDYEKWPMRKPWGVPFEELLPETRAKLQPHNFVKSENHLWEIDLDSPHTGLWRQNAMTMYEPLSYYLILAKDFRDGKNLFYLVKLKNHPNDWVQVSLEKGDNIYNVNIK